MHIQPDIKSIMGRNRYLEVHMMMQQIYLNNLFHYLIDLMPNLA
jgi:hypothetical protein